MYLVLKRITWKCLLVLLAVLKWLMGPPESPEQDPVFPP